MTRPERHGPPLMLVLSFLLLASLIPGGPIETRDFSHIPTALLLGFNVFLALLGLGSLALAFGAWRRCSGAYLGSSLAGVAYFLVYALDLAGLFPTSPSAMGAPLLAVELAGLAVAVALTICGYRSYRAGASSEGGEFPGLPRAVWLIGGAAAVPIAGFATCVAMQTHV